MSKRVNDENLLILQDEDGSEIKFEIVDIIAISTNKNKKVSP